jgi:hypothetical protein
VATNAPDISIFSTAAMRWVKRDRPGLLNMHAWKRLADMRRE